MVAAVSAVGESHAYLSQLEGYMGSDFELRPHWKVDLPTFSYEHLGAEWSPIEENAIYSVNGTWGVIIAHEWHGVAVGPPEFLTTLGTSPPFEHSLRGFLLYWKDARDRLHERTDWIPGLLVNVLGDAQATRVLREVGEPPDAWTKLPE